MRTTHALVLGSAILAAVTTADDFDRGISRDERIVHALNRLTYGPRPGEAARVRETGLERWIELQLYPERVPENPVLISRLAPLDSLAMTPAELVKKYPPPQALRQMARQGALPDDPVLRAAAERLEARLREGKGPIVAGDSPRDASATTGRLASLSPEQRRRAAYATQPFAVAQSDLLEAKLYRAIYSNRQLEEMLVDFWFNHFNVFLAKGQVRNYVAAYERDAIRPHVLRKFRDMVEATAKHPAMLIYLDNFQSVDPAAAEMLRRRRPNAPLRARGLNENYARELLELHTMGVDGGYTQQDVIEVARCFTGWSVRNPVLGGEFQFLAPMHDRRAKTVLGAAIPAGGGIEDGLKAIEIATRHPATARFISRKLAQRFVADEPPAALVERMARTFQATDGDLRAVMKTMLGSREFFSRGAWRAKLKSPLEMAASAARAVEANVSYATPLAARIGQLGQPLYRKQEPTGYPSTGEEWTSAAGLLGRLNLASAMASNRLPGVRVDLTRFEGVSEEKTAAAILAMAPSRETREAIRKGLEGKAGPAAAVAGLVLGSPEFQRK